MNHWYQSSFHRRRPRRSPRRFRERGGRSFGTLEAFWFDRCRMIERFASRADRLSIDDSISVRSPGTSRRGWTEPHSEQLSSTTRKIFHEISLRESIPVLGLETSFLRLSGCLTFVFRDSTDNDIEILTRHGQRFELLVREPYEIHDEGPGLR